MFAEPGGGAHVLLTWGLILFVAVIGSDYFLTAATYLACVLFAPFAYRAGRKYRVPAKSLAWVPFFLLLTLLWLMSLFLQG